MYKTNKFRPPLVKQGPEPGLLWPWGMLQNPLPHILLPLLWISEQTEVQMQHMPVVLDRNKMGVLVLMMTKLTFFWHHVEVTLVDYSVPHNTPIGNEILPYVEEIPDAQATAPTSGKKLILVVAHLCRWKSTLLRACSLEFRPHICSWFAMGSWGTASQLLLLYL